ncbi:hypothetical protein [Chengkuizengella marina]|uniref:Uncharacterized protein n=1 Tax=Chengkuizengella marina TaxID=2507566 RepID=A0A6N9Q4X4_9BACL|nr:hypothetical protein [Chengkuizengella marina]NBI29867.1 hypothetical protein [Chengkuizengella marina]
MNVRSHPVTRQHQGQTWYVHNTWIIGGYADKYKRENVVNDLMAELIFCDVSKEECLNRLEIDVNRRYRQDEWRVYIDKWFDQYVD